MRVVVTGVAGFIGSHLARRLIVEGHEVVGLDNLSAGVRENVPAGVRFHERDIRSLRPSPLFEGADAVAHLAAKNCLADCQADPVDTAEVNVVGTARVLEAARAAAVGRFVFADTSAEYEGVDVFPSSVGHVAPLSVYARSKHAAFSFCEAYRRFHGLSVATLRYFNVYGPGQDWRRTIPPLMSAFALKLLRGERPTIYGTGEKRRDFVHIDDVTAFNVLALTDTRACDRVWNVGSGVNHSVNDVFRLVDAILHTGLTPRYAADLPGEAQVTLADITETSALGWTPAVTLPAGVTAMIEHMREAVLPCVRP